MHRLLMRQLKRHLGYEPPFPLQWTDFLEAVDTAYRSADSTREMLERSLILSTEELHQANAEMRAIFQAIPDLLFRVDRHGLILDFKAGTDGDLLIAPRDFIGKNIQKIPVREVALAFNNGLKKSLSTASTCSIEYALNVKGKDSFFEARLVPFLSDQVVVMIQNITPRKLGEALIVERTLELQRINGQLEEEIKRRHAIEGRLLYDVSHDRLTGLPNRGLLFSRVDQCIELAKRNFSYKFALLFIDVDDFKEINDGLGHEAGDHALIGIAQRLLTSIRAVDTAARLGGDEFVVVLVGIATQEDAVLVANRIEAAMADPLRIGPHQIRLKLSIGIALSRPEHEQTADILRDADTTLYRAKREGKHRTTIFDPAMRTAVSHHSFETVAS